MTDWRCPDCDSTDTVNGANDTLHCQSCGAVNDRFVMRSKDKYDQYKNEH